MAQNYVVGQVENSYSESARLLEDLHNLPPKERTAAIEQLLRNPSPDIRGRALNIGATVLSDELLITYLKNDADDIIRNAGLEILKIRGARAFSLAVSLLKDADPDIVLQAVQLLDTIRDPRALEPLRHILSHADPNVVQAAIIGIGHLGDARALSDILEFLRADQWLQMAAVQALGDLRSQNGVAPLAGLLTDFMLGPLAAESLARIGGYKAYRALIKHWLQFHEQLDSEVMLGLLSHTAEGFSKEPPLIQGFRESLAPLLNNPSENVRISAAKCLLATGPCQEDEKAIAVLSASLPDYFTLPDCLSRRKDLISYLLEQKGTIKLWGFHLVQKFPKDVEIPVLCRALDRLNLQESFEYIVKALIKIKHPDIVPAVLNLYVRTPGLFRSIMNPLLQMYKAHIKNLINHSQDIDDETRIVVSALLGDNASRLTARILDLEPESRLRIISQIPARKDIMKQLPWSEWLKKDPVPYASLAAEIAVKTNMRELLPFLRSIIESHPHPKIIAAVGELKDRLSLSALIAHLGKVKPFTQVLIIESLGRIGGPDARKALRNAALQLEPKEARIAFKALSRCAIEEDVAFFRNSMKHPDWYVRLSCAEVLGRYPRPENMAALAGLAADQNVIVAQRALSFLIT